MLPRQAAFAETAAKENIAATANCEIFLFILFNYPWYLKFDS
jgi:hypothetical protein